ncbi:acyl carrier protein [Kitasatospora sp. NPDC058965]|uniref:acyl carrier protein n=1 Tax=Kitasatospora sp. NPDC058965 TaxID=3346682 RepID=UPI0036809711
MPIMSINDLRRILIESAGFDGADDPAADIHDVTFEELGYDSLALMESAARIYQEFGVRIPDDEITEVETPRALLDLVNGAVPAGV